MRRQAIAVGLLIVLLMPGTLEAYQPTPTRPVPRELFQPVPIPSMIAIHPEAPEASRAGVPVPTAKVIVLAVPGPRSDASRSFSLAGKASWYCWPAYPSPCAKGFPYGGDFAAAGPKLRAAICGIQSCTSWRGRTVLVNNRPVRLIDWCQCFYRQANEKLIDLYHNVWIETGARNGVTITWR